MITKADFRIVELKEYITKSENKNSEFRKATEKDILSMKQDLA